MVKIIRQWFQEYFSDPEAIVLFFILVFGFGLIIFFGSIFAPVLASIVIAYLLEWGVVHLQLWKLPRISAVFIVYFCFLGLFLLLFLVLLPVIWKQLTTLFNDLPTMFSKAQHTINVLTQKFPEYFVEEQLQSTVGSFVSDIKNWGKVVVTASLSSIASMITWIVYLVLVPLLVFFFLKDKDKLINWMSSFLPRKRGLVNKVALEVNEQIGNYIRGKVLEIIIVSFATFLVFWYFGLQYAILLAFLVGLSSLIPYVGAVVVTIPVILVAYLQWGFTSQFGYLIIFYLIVQGLDANVLIPLLFSEAVNLHPVAIVVATLFFGGIWGFWGVFFAIPLATLVKAVLYAWPKHEHAQHRPQT